jgi:hypothetical protein
METTINIIRDDVHESENYFATTILCLIASEFNPQVGESASNLVCWLPYPGNETMTYALRVISIAIKILYKYSVL